MPEAQINNSIYEDFAAMFFNTPARGELERLSPSFAPELAMPYGRPTRQHQKDTHPVTAEPLDTE